MDRDARAPARPPFGAPQTRPKAASGAGHRAASAAAVKHRVNCHRNPPKPERLMLMNSTVNQPVGGATNGTSIGPIVLRYAPNPPQTAIVHLKNFLSSGTSSASSGKSG